MHEMGSVPLCAVSLIRRDFSTDATIDATLPRARYSRVFSSHHQNIDVVVVVVAIVIGVAATAAEAADVLYRRVCVCAYVVRVGCAAYASHQQPAECSVLQSKQNSARAKIN